MRFDPPIENLTLRTALAEHRFEAQNLVFWFYTLARRVSKFEDRWWDLTKPNGGKTKLIN